MAVFRVGVQAPQGSAGQTVDLGGVRASITSITNSGAESIAYSLNGGSSWVTLAAGASGGSGTIQAGMLRLRKVSSGGYPVVVDVNATAFGVSTSSISASESAAVQAIVTAPWNRGTSKFTHSRVLTGQLQDAAAAYNFHSLVTAEQGAEFDQVRFIFQNNRTATFDVSAIAAAATSGTDTWTPTGTWVTAAGPTVAARSAAGVHGVTPSAWLDVSSVPMDDGSPRRLMLRAQVAAVAHSVTGAASSPTHGTSAGFTENGGRRMRAYSIASATDYTSTNQAGWVSGSLSGFTLITGWQLRCRRKVLTFAAVGDSNVQGVTASRNLESWGFLTAQNASLAGAPVEYFNAGQASQTSAAAVDRFEAMLVAGVVPGIAAFAGASGNDGVPSAVTTGLQRKATQKFLNLCETYRILPILTTGAPNTLAGWNGAANTIHLARQAEILAMGDQGLEVWDIGAMAADAASPAVFADGASDDGTHYNAATHAAIAARFAPRLAALAQV